MNLDRWHQANHLYRAAHPRTTPHLSGSMKCIGRCGASIAGNAKPPLCRACGLLFQAQVLADQARVDAERAAAALEESSPAGSQAQGEEGANPPPGGP